MADANMTIMRKRILRSTAPGGEKVNKIQTKADVRRERKKKKFETLYEIQIFGRNRCRIITANY
ncbi:MAG: hypothetical protein IPN69_04875 [Acidobacteria bacterium]|nr:hypothetical protein [Acidobacteriota bacterium]MBK8810048.1 hypothetical protein [Acidobacteriota bacterium]